MSYNKKQPIIDPFNGNYVELVGRINNKSSARFIRHFKEFERNKNFSAIPIWLHSFGGYLNEGLVIYDMMKRCKKPMCVFVAGECSSTALLIVSAATKGLRFASEFSTASLHFPYVGDEYTSEVNEDTARYLKRLSNSTLKTPQYYARIILNEPDYNAVLSADDMVKMGIIDHIDYPFLETGKDGKLKAYGIKK